MRMVENPTNFIFIDDERLRNRLCNIVSKCKENRKETQKEVSCMTGISLTKIKEIESGKCVDFNAINNYVNYMGLSLL